MNAQHQQCQQATSNNIKETVWKAMDKWFADNQKKLPLRQEEPQTDSLQNSKTDVRLELDDIEHCAHVEQLTRKLELADSELATLKRKAKETESRADRLRSIIVSSDGKPILDGEIQKLFSEVRKGVQMMASRLYSKSGTFQNATTENSKTFFGELNDLTPESQRDAVHTELFICIQSHFFPNDVGGCTIGHIDPSVHKQLAAAEQSLIQAVTASHPDGMSSPLIVQNIPQLTTLSSGSGQTALSDWSRATFKCIDLLRDESDGPASFAAWLEEFFRPAETDDLQEQERGRRRLRRLCDKARELGNLMRRAKDTVQVFTVEEGLAFADWQDSVEELRCNGKRNSLGLKVIDRCLFGGLKKISNDYPTKPILLERAMVSTRFSSSAK
ncbi:hypothetical protein BFJ72_g8177 [Fusarium proliferatum]|uniref:Uncharacterized protein n=1 Tax=Gibberella intermedia TaxID=948311 RepID=A0A420T591_GIBIN|nr:hypothetical protein BFJ72_g8177 [Fusarium proliferatum]